ncbi:MAG TPA: DUF6543 domain-containing protein [Luteibacter sp.]|uniref:dermonecrotic toxin domain-containing protein n=1 Tax=Luteibacter sp. TaxID=1886636 RepID=UPI002CE5F407|nr:DUF6543 domain-containing protein [Luteibacter sp.]HVI56533.1 DUF6543 domain-containing protein [Luteibacter sp.]
MDMAPPQAPPAQIQSSLQEATDAFDRIVGLQAWLATEQASIPALPETIDPGSLVPYLRAVDAYWSAPPADSAEGPTRRAAVKTRILAAARGLAVLARQDGQFDDATLAIARSLTSAAGATPAPHIKARELMFGQVPYAGVLLFLDDRLPNRVLVFSTVRGWESFANLVDAHAEMERRMRAALIVSPDLHGVSRQHVATIGPDAFVDSREIPSDPFGTLVDRSIDVQYDKLRQAWFEFSLADEGEKSKQTLVDARFDILRLDRLFDTENVLATRHAALMEAFNAQRLGRVPANVAADWRDAETDYASAQRSVTSVESQAGLPTPLDLPAYAAAAIGERLRALGVSNDPTDIQIRVDRSRDLAARLESLQALFEGPAPSYIKLVDLAYQNIAAFDPARLSASTSDGMPIAALDDATLRSLVRELDLSSRYQGYVDSTFRSGDEAPMRRAHATSLQLSHMRFLAAEARLSYYLDEVPRSFRFDRSERGYRWVKVVLDAPNAADRTRVEGHEIVARQITYRGTPLRDILAIGVRQPGSVPNVILYTPDAPDGITFREFDDRADAGRRFFYHPGFREYLLDRLPAEYARALPNGSGREFVGEHLANWVLGSGSTSAYTRTDAPFEEREVNGDFLASAYEVDVQLGLRNVQAFTRSAEQAHWSWLVETLGNASTQQVVTNAITGVVTAPGRAAQAAWRLYDNIKAGDGSQAFVDFADFYNVSLSVALPAYALGSASVARGLVGARFRAGPRLVEARPAVQPAVVFEPRFAATNVRKAGQANRDGILTIEGKTYIEHRGQLYRVLHDSDYGSWRLARPDAGSAFRGPAIERTAWGSWTYRRVGLRGGSGRGQAGGPDRLPDLYDEFQAEIERAFPDPLERDLVAARMRMERTAPASTSIAPISVGQRTRWNEALAAARWAHFMRTTAPLLRAPAAPVDLTSRFGSMREVPRAQAPDDLWYYGRVPFKDSDLIRHRGNPGYSKDLAEITPRFIDHGVHGVRVTTVPPTASIERIREAMGAPDLNRTTTFSVRIDPGSLYEPPAAICRQRFMCLGNGANAELLAPTRGPAEMFVVRSNSWGTLKLGAGQFHVESTLPPPTSP